MGHCFSHLQLTDRRKIEYGLNRGDTPKQIAAELHVHVSTIYREIKRSRWEWLDGATWITEDRYNPDGAERRYRENLAAKGAPLKIGNDRELADYLERKVIEEDRSPAAALADIELEGRTFNTVQGANCADCGSVAHFLYNFFSRQALRHNQQGA